MKKEMHTIDADTKEAWNKNWQPHEIGRVMEIFSYPRVRKQIDLYTKYLPKDQKILEGGCGLGPYLIYLHSMGYDVIGIDYNEEPLKKIKEYDSSLEVSVMDVRDIKFPNGYFGGYLSLGVIEHFPEGPERAIDEAARVLKEQGIFIIQVPIMNLFLMLKYPLELLKRNRFIRRMLKRPDKQYYWQQYFKAKRLKKILEERGFKVAEIVPMDHEHSIISFSSLFRNKSSYDGANNIGLRLSEFCAKYLPWLTAANMVLICRREN